MKILCCALALACIATATACRQATATTTIKSSAVNTNARRMQLEHSVYTASDPQNFHNVFKR